MQTPAQWRRGLHPKPSATLSTQTIRESREFDVWIACTEKLELGDLGTEKNYGREDRNEFSSVFVMARREY